MKRVKKYIGRLLGKNSYQQRIENELKFYKDCAVVNDLPEIFHYWSNKYLLPKQQVFGFNNPDEFFYSYAKKVVSQTEKTKILSIGSGNCNIEVELAAKLNAAGYHDFIIECMDINQDMFNRGQVYAKEKNVSQHLRLLKADFNTWKTKSSYDLIIANQSLHHVMELEHLFSAIHEGLSEDGYFITSDMIGRNGHMRWPEALEALQPFWEELPDKYKYNQLMRRQEQTYINHDCSTSGFEGIRAQDILALLVDTFEFELFIPFANLIMVFIDRPFGHNFDVNNPKDLDFIDRVHARDEAGILSGELKPTQMLAAMKKNKTETIKLDHPITTPEFCVRKY